MAIPRRYIPYPMNVHPPPSTFSRHNLGVPRPYWFNYALPLEVSSYPALGDTEPPEGGIELRELGQKIFVTGIGIAIPALVGLLVSLYRK